MKGSVFAGTYSDTPCTPVIYSERHMGSMTSAIPKCYLFTDIFRNSENVDGSEPSTALLEKDFIWTMGNVGKKTCRLKTRGFVYGPKYPF